MKTILVTGGAGFIGSHTCLVLLEKNYDLFIVDSNINSSKDSLNRVKIILQNKINNLNEKIFFFKGDIRDKNFIRNVFYGAKERGKPIDAVIHFAGLKAAGESVFEPLKYWEFNVGGSLNLFQVMIEFECNTIVFSSSATIYGDVSRNPLTEKSLIKPINPYGQTKAAIETMLEDIFNISKDSWRIANLRYFNPIGAHESGLIGEHPYGKPNNLFPYICDVAMGVYSHLNVYGNDWPTNDGTGVRDYIHVMDLAFAHYLALEFLFKNTPQKIAFNIGTGKGTSVLELVKAFVDVNNCQIPTKVVERRSGDVPFLIAETSLASSILNWKPRRSIQKMCKDGWNWKKNNPYGFKNYKL